MGDISSSRQPLCYCTKRELVLGTKAYVCQVCEYYSKSDRKTTEVYEKSKDKADKLIEEEEIGEVSLEAEEGEEIDLSVDEFEEEEITAERYEKKRTGTTIEEAEEFAEMECPFCGEIFDNLAVHIRECEFAPEDVDVEDYLPTRTPKKVKKEKKEEESESKDKIPCPYCGKNYIRLGRHLPYCDDRPDDADEEKEELYKDGKVSLDEFNK
jgi:predicted RNA-binding Zn-ribbon protein involved in translation (DUF1610 family)